MFVQDIDARKPLIGRVKEGEKRERDREREMERGRDRDRDREESGADRIREMSQESGRGKGQVRGEFVASPGNRPRQRSPLSPLSQRERGLSPMTALEGITAESAVPAALGNTTVTTTSSPPAASTSPNRGPMLTNQEDVEEKLKRMNETFLRSLEGIGKGGGSVRRRDKEKGKEKEVERDTTIRRGMFLVSPTEDDPVNPSGGGGPSSASPYPAEEQPPHPNSPTRIPSPTSSASSSSNNQPGIFYPHQTNDHALGLEIGRGRGVVRSTHTSTSTSTSASSEAVGGGASQGSQEVIGRMDFLW